MLLGSGVGFALEGRGSDVGEAGAVNVPLSHQSQVGQRVLLQHLDRFFPGVLEESRLGPLGGRVDGGDGARKRRGWPAFPPPSALSSQRGVQALGLMARVEQVAAAPPASSSSPVIAIGLISPATAAGEAAVVGVTGVRGGATGLSVVGRRRGPVGCHRRQAQKVWELQVAFV